jgi:hypothetical protein
MAVINVFLAVLPLSFYATTATGERRAEGRTLDKTALLLPLQNN